MIAATAASMDGYTAFGAAITHDGFKQTFACPAPRAVVADLDILAHGAAQHDRLRLRGAHGKGDSGR
jgi:glycerol-1-phosphate dehydrogenase [NAD(P)+]